MVQNRTEKYNLTEGKILNKLLLIALPIMGTQLLQMTYNLTDMFWLGRVSSDAVAASGTAGMYLWLSMAFLMVGRMGAEIGVAQNLGKGDKENARTFSYHSIFLAVTFGIVFTAIMIVFRNPLIGFFKIQEANVAKDAANYLAIVAVGITPAFVTGAVNGAFNGAGNSKLPFYMNGIGLIVNMLLDPLFIFGLNLGIMGAALATITAQFIVCIIFLVAIKYSREKPFQCYQFKSVLNVQKDKIWQIFRWSIPISMESLFFTLLSMMISRFVASYGAGAIAIQRVGSQVESLSWLIGGGFSSALTAFIGQNYGAGKWKRVREGFKISTVLMISYGLLVTTALFFGARVIFTIFIPGDALTAGGISYMRILAACQVATCVEALGNGAFRGIGKTVPPSLVSIICNSLRVPLAYLLSLTPLGLNGIWWGITIGGIFRGALILGWYLIDMRRQPKE